MSDSTKRPSGPTEGVPPPRGRFPLARSHRVLIEELDDETLVYDLETHEAHCLNKAAALVWRRSDGKTSVEALMDVLPEANLPRELSLVWLALADLEKAGLLAEYEAPGPGNKISRRQVLRTLGTTAGLTLALPAVSSLVAPLAAQAASCLTQAECKSQNKKNCTGLPICGFPNFCCQAVGAKKKASCQPVAC